MMPWVGLQCVIIVCLDHTHFLDFLTLKAPPIICSRRQFQLLLFFFSKITNKAYQNSHEISNVIFVES